ncbi:MAG: hypothetical protein A3E87_04140 [Gammaproteobacteria bacterium RIFCSPHIGHO2_12_FULL_35_23]|nr:MAG: hypothetical protein A3E87_04140 [Gammaproteobacteria bacterium RIFCSPHIGHO2_12_FULL_35_23]
MLRRILIIFYCLLTPWISFAATTDNLQFKSASFAELPGWQQANLTNSLNAFKTSCSKTLSLPSNTIVGTPVLPLTVANWQGVCKAALKLHPVNQVAIRQFFEAWFNVYTVMNHHNPQGLFTGYYLPEFKGQLHYSSDYSVPIYARPSDLVTVKLGLFRLDLQGKKIAGRVIDGKLYPYSITQQQIDNGALVGKAKIIAWVAHRADRLVLQVQGSGIILLSNGQQVLLGYDGDNGQPYYPIGRWFLQNHIFPKNSLSMLAIYQWLIVHPKQGDVLIEQDPAFVFFTTLSGSAPLGTENIPLTAGYSLAVDNNIIPLGSPLWLNTNVPNVSNTSHSVPLKRLFIAQDTGGAIYGGVRGDIYFGAGLQAATQASSMKQPGRYWLLLPKNYQLNQNS